jgi:hypothetical protein
MSFIKKVLSMNFRQIFPLRLAFNGIGTETAAGILLHQEILQKKGSEPFSDFP